MQTTVFTLLVLRAIAESTTGYYTLKERLV